MNITEKDLNNVEVLNASGSANGKEGKITSTIVNGEVVPLKGILGRYNNSFSSQDELAYINALKTGVYEFLTEQYEYSNLPEGLTKYRIEQKIIENGSVYIVEDSGQLYAVNATITQWNMYNEPAAIIVNEPRSTLNGNKYSLVNNEAWYIRNNILQTTKFPAVYRFIKQLEKIFFQIEKNLLTSAPKGLIDIRLGTVEFDGPNEEGLADSMEEIVNSQNTFFTVRDANGKMQGKGAGLTDGDNSNLYTPIELTDRTENLIKNYVFVKEQLKEIIGADMNAILGKKERMVTDEIESQQEISSKTELHGFMIRKEDLSKVNEIFGTNIQLELADEEEEEGENVVQQELDE